MGYTFANGQAPNTMGAFRAAVERGYGIELDTQPDRDGQWVVFHNSAVGQAPVALLSLSELREASGADVPLLSDVLEMVAGQVPVIVEIKDYGQNSPEEYSALADMLGGYSGALVIQSFSPDALSWFRENSPEIIRGQLGTNYFKEETVQNFKEKLLLTGMLLDWRSRPDFIAWDVGHLDDQAYMLTTRLFRVPVAVWTVRDKATFDKCRERFDIVIFDSFDPEA